MRLAIILATVGICGLGYAVYNSFQETDNSATHIQRVEGEVGDMLYQLVDHLHACTQYYERRTWDTYVAIQMTEQGMAMPEGEERAMLRAQMGQYVKHLNMYKQQMGPFYREELGQAWDIALKLKDMELHNPEQAALFQHCWDKIVPYALDERYVHPTLESNKQVREQIVEATRKKIIRRKEEYVEQHKEVLQWEEDYAYIKSEDIMAKAELATAKQDMVEADHALALKLAENSSDEAINNAMAHAAQATDWYNEAKLKSEQVDMAMTRLETARIDMAAANHHTSLTDSLEQVLMEHQQPGEELHPNLPRGARIVPGNDTQPPAGGWWAEFVQWIYSWFS